MSMLPTKGRYVPFKNDNKGTKQPISETRIIVISFLAILIPSAFLLTLPWFSVSGLSFTDAMFTATSAISVTGLGVVDAGTHFTTSGQVVLMFLMQIGGLGQMTLSAVLLYLFGVRLTLRQQSLAKEALGQEKNVDIRRLVKSIIAFALIAELIGMGLMAIDWVPQFGWHDGLFNALFHSISAFNNAGFSLFANNMVPYVSSPLICLTLAALFISGGIGFTVVADIKENFKKGFKSFTLHTKIMLVGTPTLLIVGTVLIWLLEHHNPTSLGDLPFGTQWLAAFFQSASARTAGFNTVDLTHFGEPALLIMIILMLIGAGSTSTGGGIKVSTFFVSMSATWAFLRQRKHVTMFKRTIPDATVTKCLAIMVVTTIILTLAVFSLMVTQKAPFIEVLFETISAFATVGLTDGLTAHLNETGKIIMIIVMIIGRIGPLTLAYMFATPKPSLVKYPEGNVFAG